MQFAPLKSYVDTPFFAELAKYKLEDAKLSDARKSIWGFITPPPATDRPPSLQLTSDSLYDASKQKESLKNATSTLCARGELLNLNTLDAFKSLDKLALLRSEARKLAQSILSGDALESPNLLCSFLLLSFADLKKYKFYYWLLFPALAWTSEATLRTNSSLTSSEIAEIDSQLRQFPDCVCLLHNNEVKKISALVPRTEHIKAGIRDFGSQATLLPYHLRNFAALLTHYGVKTVELYVFRPCGTSYWLDLRLNELSDEQWDGENAHGWERNAMNRLSPKMSDVSSLLDPSALANQAVDLNLKLMKWRAMPQIDLAKISARKCLLLGAGTLGTYISRGLMAWGVRHISLVDSGTVSYSNPVRQPLYVHTDCVEHAFKAETAARALQQVFPSVQATGYCLEIPMLGHPVSSEARQQADYERLVQLIEEHDVVFLLLDSREARWLPTVIARALHKEVINVALGLDSYVVMRHGLDFQLGCYFCNDVVAPGDSTSRLTLDQMCTVTRPGCAMIASGHAIELYAATQQAKDGGYAPHNAPTVLGPLPHQIRGFLSSQEVVKVWAPAFPQCSACSSKLTEEWKTRGWDFVKQALSSDEYITELSGLGELQRQTEELELEDFGSEDGLF